MSAGMAMFCAGLIWAPVYVAMAGVQYNEAVAHGTEEEQNVALVFLVLSVFGALVTPFLGAGSSLPRQSCSGMPRFRNLIAGAEGQWRLVPAEMVAHFEAALKKIGWRVEWIDGPLSPWGEALPGSKTIRLHRSTSITSFVEEVFHAYQDHCGKWKGLDRETIAIKDHPVLKSLYDALPEEFKVPAYYDAGIPVNPYEFEAKCMVVSILKELGATPDEIGWLARTIKQVQDGSYHPF